MDELFQLEFVMLNGHDRFSEFLVLVFDVKLLAFQLFDFLSFSLSGRLSSLAVSKNPLYPSLFLFIFSLCSFSVERQYATRHIHLVRCRYTLAVDWFWVQGVPVPMISSSLSASSHRPRCYPWSLWRRWVEVTEDIVVWSPQARRSPGEV